MTLDFLDGSYRLYKAQTEFVLKWLTTEGNKRRVREPKKGLILTSTTQRGAAPVYVIDVSDIVPFARLVVQASKSSAPSNVLQTLRSTITSRRRCTAWYQGQNIDDVSLTVSNQRHEYFNNVLDELFNVLAYSHDGGDGKASNARFEESKSIANSISKENPFEVLELESSAYADQVDDLASALQAVELPKPDPKKPQTETAYQIQDSKEDIRFAVFKMLTDLNRVRRHIHERMEQYRTGNRSLVSVSAVINCAIGIVRGIEREFIESMPQFTSWEKVMDTIVSPNQFENIFTGPVVHSETAYLRSVFCLPFEELRCFREHLVRKTNTKFLYGRVSVRRTAGSQIDNEDNWEADKIILHEFFEEICLLGFAQPLPLEDELTHGIMEAFKDNPVHLWVVFGVQIFLDTQQILGTTLSLQILLTVLTIDSGEEVTRPFREFKASSDAFRSNVEDWIKYTEVMRKKHFDPAKLDSIRRNSLELNKWATDDICMKQRELHPELGPGRPFFFLTHNPVVCGLLQCATLLKSQSWGIRAMNNSIYAVAAAHLYNAARNEGDLPSRWPDMETLIGLYGRSDIFLGAPPKTIHAYARHHLVARGASATNFAKDKRGDFAYSNTGPRHLKVPEIMKTFDEFLCQKDATRTDVNVDLLERFLHRTAHSRGTQKVDSSSKVGPVQLLILLEQCMEEEEAKLVFNYWALHLSSWSLLFNVYLELKDEFIAALSPEHRRPNPNSLLHHLPRYIFHQLGKGSSKKGAKKEDILSRVGRVMDKYVSDKGQVPSSATVGVVNDEGLKTEVEHGTQNDTCIHWGLCDRLKGGAQG